MIGIIILFIILVVIYIVTNKTSKYDIWIIFLSTLVLLFTVLRNPWKKVETFADSATTATGAGTSTALSTQAKLISNLDLYNLLNNRDQITKNLTEQNLISLPNYINLQCYLSVFQTQSDLLQGKIWKDATPDELKSKRKNCNFITSDFEFVNSAPSATNIAVSGVDLNANPLRGPECSNLNIKFQGNYTIIMVVKHHDLINEKTVVKSPDNTSIVESREIELLKLYANSPNNNALALYIKRTSDPEKMLQRQNNVQMGSLCFQYSDSEPVECLESVSAKMMHLDKDLLSFYFIVRDLQSISVYFILENTEATKKELILLARIATPPNSDINFSNKEVVINRLNNWNASIYNFAIFDTNFSDTEIITYFNQIMSEYIKNNDKNFNTIFIKYNQALEYLENFTKCPFDDKTCSACSSITNWTETQELLLSTPDCRKAIQDFCSKNTGHPNCKCWDFKNPAANSTSCKHYRSIFGDSQNYLNYLTIDDLEYIKQKYKLLYLEECPKKLQEPEILKNEYENYDYDKLKVAFDARISTTQKCDASKDKPDVDPNLEKIKVRPPADFVGGPPDLFDREPNYGFDPTNTKLLPANSTTPSDVERREQLARLRIGEAPREAPLSGVVDPKAAKQLLGDQYQKTPDSGSDSFFNRFIKVMGVLPP